MVVVETKCLSEPIGYIAIRNLSCAKLRAAQFVFSISSGALWQKLTKRYRKPKRNPMPKQFASFEHVNVLHVSKCRVAGSLIWFMSHGRIHAGKRGKGKLQVADAFNAAHAEGCECCQPPSSALPPGFWKTVGFGHQACHFELHVIRCDLNFSWWGLSAERPEEYTANHLGVSKSSHWLEIK